MSSLLLFCRYTAYAQTFDEYKQRAFSDFNKYKSEKERDFKEYRDRINAEFAEYMRRAWPEYNAQPAVPVPDRPEPPRPVVKDPDAGPSNDPIPFDNVIPTPLFLGRKTRGHFLGRKRDQIPQNTNYLLFTL